MPFASGENVGAYRIIEKLGQGGMATVFKAYHPALDRYVAIKVLHPGFTQQPGFLKRFQREAQIVARLDHPHIVPIYDFAEHRGQPYLVMRFIEGETLKARMRQGPLPVEEILRITRAVGQALSYAHDQGILHRDIKPSNVLLSPDGGVYLTDFGLARMAEAGESTISRDTLLGTPQYISPEQAKGLSELDARTDIYSLGVVLYELLVGRVPFTADTPYAIVHDHIFTPLPLPRSLKPDLPEAIERVLLKALAKDPEDRFQTVGALVTALEAASEPLPPPPLPETAAAPPPTEALPREAEGVPDRASGVLEEKEKRKGRKKEKKEEKKKKRRLWPWVLLAGLVGVVLLGLIVIAAIAVGQRREGGAPAVPRSAEQLLEDARAARGEEKYARALALYRRAVAVDPGLVPAYLEGTELLIETGDANQAMEFLQEGVAANPDDVDLHLQLAELALSMKRWDVAQREVEWLLHETPESPLPHAYAGLLILARGGTCEEALPELDAALEVNPDLAWAHYGLALCHLQGDDVEAARAELEFVLGQDDIPPALRIRAEQLLERIGSGPAPGDARQQEFEALFRQAERIPERDNLRGEFLEMLERADTTLGRGDQAGAIDILHQAKEWVGEHADQLVPSLAEELNVRLDRLIRLAGES